MKALTRQILTAEHAIVVSLMESDEIPESYKNMYTISLFGMEGKVFSDRLMFGKGGHAKMKSPLRPVRIHDPQNLV